MAFEAAATKEPMKQRRPRVDWAEALRRRRQPDGTVLYKVVRDNLTTLLAAAIEVGRGLPRYEERDFARCLECGGLAYGFARVRSIGGRPARRAPVPTWYPLQVDSPGLWRTLTETFSLFTRNDPVAANERPRDMA